MMRVVVVGLGYCRAMGLALMAGLARAADVVVPRLIKEEVALRLEPDGYHIICSAADVRSYERPDAVATMRSFNVCGRGMWPRMVGKVRPWPVKAQHRARRGHRGR